MNDTNTIRDSSSRSLACSPLSATILKRRFLRRLIIALLTSAVAWNQFFQPVDRLDKKLTLNTTIISSVEKKHAESDNDHKDPPSPASATRKTAVVIFTHLIMRIRH
mmetsp:Transcript_22612/g.38564  ORF Transcript_22612/g.38564 Transcript_22612/m.38564 type:complete len:107 (-) Transcript_22612:934-1254(-)